MGVLVCAFTRIGVRALLGRDFGVLGLMRAEAGLGEEARCFVTALGLEKKKKKKEN